ncbi:MAG: hypothetical protein JW913_00860 [Chitinispirillaceae bacterium]|nr:hypothetical protein [Chitinispirillaceae bacterium]
MKKLILNISFIAAAFIIIGGCSNENPVQVCSENSNDYKEAMLSEGYWEFDNPPTRAGVPAMAASTKFPGNIEIVRRTPENKLEPLWWNWSYNTWQKTSADFGSGIISDPALCVNREDDLLQVVARDWHFSDKLVHYYRDNGLIWHENVHFSSNCYGSPAMISNCETGNLEVVVREWGSRTLKYIVRNQNGVWEDQGQLPNNDQDQYVIGDPSFTQTLNDKVLHVVCFTYHTRDKANRYYLHHWTKYRNGSWVWQNAPSKYLKGLDPSVRPAIAPYNATISIWVKKVNETNRLRSYYTCSGPGVNWDWTEDSQHPLETEKWSRYPSAVYLPEYNQGHNIYISYFETELNGWQNPTNHFVCTNGIL